MVDICVIIVKKRLDHLQFHIQLKITRIFVVPESNSFEISAAKYQMELFLKQTPRIDYYVIILTI